MTDVRSEGNAFNDWAAQFAEGAWELFISAKAARDFIIWWDAYHEDEDKTEVGTLQRNESVVGYTGSNVSYFQALANTAGNAYMSGHCDGRHEFQRLTCNTCHGSGRIILSGYPDPRGEYAPAVCLSCNGTGLRSKAHV